MTQVEFIVSMVRDSAEAGGRDLFSCSSGAWGLLGELGRAFGWKPAGAVYVPRPGAPLPVAAARHGYEPGDEPDYKLVDAADAIAWATALSTARRSPHLEAMLGARPGPVALHNGSSDTQLRSANAPFIVVLDEFTEYAYGGAFAFVRSR